MIGGKGTKVKKRWAWACPTMNGEKA